MRPFARRERLLHLLHRGAITVPEAAKKLGISVRTAQRDVAILREQGHTIEGSPGPGGGVRVSPESRPQAVHFEVAEIIGLVLSVAVTRATPGVPFADSAEAALDRARRALSSERQRAIRALEQRILVGKPSSTFVLEGLGAVEQHLLTAFEEAFTARRALAFGYLNGKGERSEREAECVALLLRHPAWYVLAWDLKKDAPRMFRMDRMHGAEVAHPITAPHSLASVTHEAAPDARVSGDRLFGPPLG